ncbi:MAG: squalene--hopene cyclase [Acidobacteriota bacterium]|jgi:squalene-hopene/tetraprenyl-beta-curcumene cyclase
MSFSWTNPSPHRRTPHPVQLVGERRALFGAAREASRRSAQSLIAIQKADGHWCGELLADVSLEADYILLQLWLHPPADGVWYAASTPRLEKVCRRILSQQMPDGGWNIYPEGPADVNCSVKAYTALRLCGYPPDFEPLRRARYRILDLGGLQACNSYTKINLSLFGLYPRKYVPTIPPELMLLPGGSLFPGGVLYEMASWTRAIVVPLSIVQAVGGIRPAPAGIDLHELIHPGYGLSLPKRDRLLSPVFHQVDRLLKLWERRGHRDSRIAAIRQAERWMLERCRHADGLGAIYPSMMYSIMALEALEYPKDHPDLLEAIAKFDALFTETPESIYFQPCFSPVWDTAYAAFALGETNHLDPTSLRHAADWLITKEVRRRGDWSVKRPHLQPGGWAFEYANEHYPDIDDTAMVLLALEHCQASRPEQQSAVEARALVWLKGMQSQDGGFAAFDADNDWCVLNSIPFSDHNAMLDPTCPDITGRVLEALCRRGLPSSDPAVHGAVNFLLKTQEQDGSWYGRWGVNYLYGTFLALRGLRAAGSPDRNVFRRAADFVQANQNADGGWGESCLSYEVNRFVPAPSTPSQTAWALLSLLSAGRHDSPAAERGLQYLIETQNQETGDWDESLATGTGFPNVFYLKYTLYRHYFPMLVTGLYGRLAGF